MITDKDFTIKTFLLSMQGLESVDGLMDLLFGEHEDKEVKLTNLLSEIDNQAKIAEVLYSVVNKKSVNKFIKIALRIGLTTKSKFKRWFCTIYIYLFSNLIKTQGDLGSFFSVFMDNFNTCIQVMNSIGFNRPENQEEMKYSSKQRKLVFNSSGSDIYIDIVKTFYEVRRFVMKEAGLSLDEIESMQVVSLFYYYCKLVEETNGGRNNGNL